MTNSIAFYFLQTYDFWEFSTEVYALESNRAISPGLPISFLSELYCLPVGFLPVECFCSRKVPRQYPKSVIAANNCLFCLLYTEVRGLYACTIRDARFHTVDTRGYILSSCIT